MSRTMKLVAFMQAQNCSNYPASWRHPLSVGNWDTRGYYEGIGRTLERGKFHLAFFDDRLAIPDRFGDDFTETVRHGVRAVKLDPVSVALAMGLATEKLGIGVTYSTTYYEPFHIARVFATMDLLLKGRAAWNVVTSLNDSEAANFGASEHLAHDLRYDRADEFMEVVLGHWDTWEPDAIVADRASGLFADPAKVHRLDYQGKFVRSRGPFTVPPSDQGRPVIIQAGQSGRGREFASRWSELIFAIYPNLAAGTKQYRDMKDHLAGVGRPDTVIAPAVYTIVAPTRSEAEDKMAEIDKLAKPIDALALLSEVLNFDFATKQPDEAFTTDELNAVSGLRAVCDRVVAASGKTNPTINDFIRYSNRGTIREFPIFMGSPTEVADQMEEWFAKACDGFVVSATHMPGSYEDFVNLAVPELQRRGLFRKDYEGATLRDNLGFGKAQRGDWKARPPSATSSAAGS